MPQPGDRKKSTPAEADEAPRAGEAKPKAKDKGKEKSKDKAKGRKAKADGGKGPRKDGQAAEAKDGRKKSKGGKAKGTKTKGSKAKPPRFDPVDVPDPAVGRLIEVRRSGVHGQGVFAIAPIARGDTIIEYVGRRMSHKKADKLPPIDPDEPNHTFFFQIRDGRKVIDAAVGGSAARWINHACAPNCEAEEDEDGRVFIKALRKIKPEQELFYDYGLVLDEPYTRQLKKDYACRCGAPKCRGTMLAPKR